MESRFLDRFVPNPGEPLDPNLFHLDWDQLFEVLLVIIVLSFFLERALSLLFESRSFLLQAQKREVEGRSSIKAPIAFAVSAAVCVFWQFDAFSIVLLREHTTILGAILTGAIIAGGSKASIKLFVDMMGVRSAAYSQLGGSAQPPPRSPDDGSGQPTPAGDRR